MRHALRHPGLVLSLLVAWLLLVGSVSPGALLLGIAVALIGGGAAAAMQLPRPRLRRLARLPELLRDIAAEVFRSNAAVARIILRGDADTGRRSGFVRIPLDLRSPTGLTALACILTATPGTIWVDYDTTDGTMLLHVLDVIDEEAWTRIVKDRWEKRLMEILE